MILCIGTTPTVQRTMAFSKLTLDAVNRAVDVRQTASGKSVNVARVLNAFEYDVLATGFLGGAGGEYVRRALDDSRIPHEFVNVGPPTRTCVTVIDRGSGAVTELVEEPQRVQPTDYENLLSVVHSNLWRSQMLVLSGSLTPFGAQDFYAKCTRMARDAGIRVIVDARGECLRLALPEGPTIAKPNKAELQDTVGFVIDSAERLQEAVSQLLGRGAGSVVVTMGAEGAFASDGHESWWVRSPRVAAVNPIGSGDAFAAGLAMGLLQAKPLPDICSLAAACGAANALTPTSGEVRVDDVHRLLKEVTVERA